jgi:hypothetical protein
VRRKGDTTAKKESKPRSPLVGRRHIISMSMWDEDYLNEEVRAYIQFEGRGGGSFQFGYVRSILDSSEGLRDGQPAAEFSWEGGDEAAGTPLTGRGWAMRKGEGLHGLIALHLGDESEFEAERAGGTRRPTRR